MSTGSSVIKYEPTEVHEYGFGKSIYHAIEAMKEYENEVSIEEIRIADYNASGGLFGSVFAKIGAALCSEPQYKLRPYYYGELYHAAIASTNIQQPKKFGSQIEQPFNGIKKRNQSQKPNGISVTIIGKQYTKIYITGSTVTNVNLLFKESAIRDDGMSSEASPEMGQKDSQKKVNNSSMNRPIKKHEIKKKPNKEEDDRDRSTKKHEIKKKSHKIEEKPFKRRSWEKT